MSETDLARSWTFAPFLGGDDDMPEPNEKEGRWPWTELSARDLSCSDQLNPCWSGREEYTSEGGLADCALLACAWGTVGRMLLVPRRPVAELELAPKAAEWLPGEVDDGPRAVACMLLRRNMPGMAGWAEGEPLGADG